MSIAYIGLGSNLGDRRHFLDAALESLRNHPRIKIATVSPYEESEPVGGPAGQGKYLNAAAALETDLQPSELLAVLQEIENRLGRVRQERFGPRTIDLDLLLYDQTCVRLPDLEVPHPRMAERLFVLGPLATIAPLAVHPRLQSTVADLLRNLRQGSRGVEGTLKGQRALVTGSTSGIGKAIVLELASAGADILIHGNRSRDRAEEVTGLCQAHGVRTGILMADLRDAAATTGLAEAAWKHWGGLDILVSNAGADTLTGPAAHWTFDEKLAALWEIDVLATIRLTRHVGENMRSHGEGAILTMGWDQAESGMEGDSGQLFAATKGAVMAFTRSLAVSLAPQVRVNCLAPGWIRTAWGEGASAQWQKRVLRETPLGRWGVPEDVARAARWLVSPNAAYITGQTFRIDGGAVRG